MKGAETKNVLLAIDNLYQFENNIIIALVRETYIIKKYYYTFSTSHTSNLNILLGCRVTLRFFLVTFPHQYHKLKFCILYKLKNCSRWHFDDDHKQLSYYLLETWCSDDVMRNKKLSPRNHQYCTLNNIQLWIRRDTPYLFPRL